MNQPGRRAAAAEVRNAGSIGHGCLKSRPTAAVSAERQAAVAAQSKQHLLMFKSVTLQAQRGPGLTLRSTGAPTAGHLGPAWGTRYIFPARAKASCRCRPVTSNVRPRNSPYSAQQLPPKIIHRVERVHLIVRGVSQPTNVGARKISHILEDDH